MVESARMLTPRVLQERLKTAHTNIERLKAADKNVPQRSQRVDDDAKLHGVISQGVNRSAYVAGLAQAEHLHERAINALKDGDVKLANHLLRKLEPQVTQARGLWKEYHHQTGNKVDVLVVHPPSARLTVLNAVGAVERGETHRVGDFLLNALGEWDRSLLSEVRALAVELHGSKVEPMMQRLYAEGFFARYLSDAPSLAGALTKAGTNCVGQTMLITSMMYDADPRHKGWEFGVQLFADHIQPVLTRTRRGKTEVWNVFTNERVKGVIAPIFKPELLHHAYLAGRGVNVGSAEHLLLHRGPESAWGKAKSSAVDYSIVDANDALVFPGNIVVRYSDGPPPKEANLGTEYPEAHRGDGRTPQWDARYAEPMPADVKDAALDGQSVREIALDAAALKKYWPIVLDRLLHIGMSDATMYPLWSQVLKHVGQNYNQYGDRSEQVEFYDGQIMTHEYHEAITTHGARAVPMLSFVVQHAKRSSAAYNAALEMLADLGVKASSVAPLIIRRQDLTWHELHALKNIAPKERGMVPRLMRIVQDAPIKIHDTAGVYITHPQAGAAIEYLGVLGYRARQSVGVVQEYALSRKRGWDSRKTALRTLLKIRPQIAVRTMRTLIESRMTKKWHRRDLLSFVHQQMKKHPELNVLQDLFPAGTKFGKDAQYREYTTQID